jgi:O-succinylbenzoate synthase
MMRVEPLRIARILLHWVRVPLCEPFRISNGSVVDKDAIVVEIITERGVTGWGEASPMSGSFYSSDTPETTWRALCDRLLPLALTLGEIDAERFYLALRDHRGEPFAKAGLEGAVWDACAHSMNTPLCGLFGTTPQPVASGVAIGIYDTTDELLARVDRFVGEGYRRVKIKIEPGWDVKPVSAVRGRFPRVPLMVDANAAYTLDDRKVFRELDGYGLMMIEQPMGREAYDDAAELQRELSTPLCADESAESLDALETLIEKRCARIINIKVQRVGGLSEAILMLKRARAAGLDCWVGTMPELGIASAQGLHFASLDGFGFPTDIEASARWYLDDLVEPAIKIDRQGYIHLPEGSGSGFRVDRAKLERYTVRTEEFS